MRVSCIAFTERGYALAERTARALSDCAQTGEDDPGWDVSVSRGFGEGKADLRAWTAHAWEASDALLFVGAAGIAVRAIAPHVASKTNDPAVVAIDEAGRFAVPLLSGHLGGANELAQTVARAVGAIPVITTATDVRGVWAVDTWARRAGLAVSNPEAIKRVSARLLSGGRVTLYSDMPISGQPPEGVDIASDRARADIVVSPFAGANAGASVRAAETTGKVVPAAETGKPAGVRAPAPAPARPPASPSQRRAQPCPLSPPRERTHLHSRQQTAKRRYRPERGRTQCQPPQAAVPKSACRNRASRARPKAAAPTLA